MSNRKSGQGVVLSYDDEAARLEWAKKHKNKTFEDWANVVWAGECIFQLYNNSGIRSFWCRKEDYFKILNRLQYEPPRVNKGVTAWSCITANGMGELSLTDGRLNSKKYVNVLENYLEPFILTQYGDLNSDSALLMQNNNPFHASAQTISWLREKNIHFVFIPPRSPDLNPLDGIWSKVKKRILKKCHETHEDLKRGVVKEWANVTEEECREAVKNMPKIIKMVIKQKGAMVKL